MKTAAPLRLPGSFLLLCRLHGIMPADLGFLGTWNLVNSLQALLMPTPSPETTASAVQIVKSG